jgi:hypothetical protein
MKIAPLALLLFTSPAGAFSAADIPPHPEIFNLGETVAARSKLLYDHNQSDGYGIGFSHACIYFNALCIDASPRGNIFDMRIIVDSTMTGYVLVLCVMSSDMNLVKCKSQNPAITMSFQKNGNAWIDTIDTLGLLGKDYGTTFHLKKSCNLKGCETGGR